MKQGTLLKIVLWSVVFYLAIIVLATNVAKAEFEQYEPVPVSTTCPANWLWPDAWGLTFREDWHVELAPEICRALRKGPGAKLFPQAAHVLLHEWVHSYYQTDDESAAECVSLFILRYQLVTRWHLSPQRAQRIYKSALATHYARAFWYPQYACPPRAR